LEQPVPVIDIQPYLVSLSKHLSPERLQHSLGVMQVMEALAPIYHLDPAAARLAGLAHDAGKELPLERMYSIARSYTLPLDEPTDRDPLYLHGPCSAYLAQHEMGIQDAEVLEAIFRHSYLGNGAVQSPVFCWCLRFADMLEPGRDWQDLRDVLEPLVYAGRMAAAARQMMDWLIPFLARIGVEAHPAQVLLQRKLAQLVAPGKAEVSNDLVPV
jgi:predicted HD superfamily hydrolase involved in NAD metabolism